MPPTKYYNHSHGRSSSGRNSSSTQQTTPTTPTPPSGVSIMSNKSSTTLDPRLASNASAIIPQPRRRRSSVSREQSPPSDDITNNPPSISDAANSPKDDDQKHQADMNNIDNTGSGHDSAAINTFNTTTSSNLSSQPFSTTITNNITTARNQHVGGFSGTATSHTAVGGNKDSSHVPSSNSNSHSHHHSHHHHHNSHSSHHQVSQSNNITDDDSDIQAGLSTNAIQKIYNTTLQFNAESILAAVDQLQNRRAEQFPDEKRLRYSIRDVLDIGTSNPICTEKHPDLPELDYRKLDWGIVQPPSSTAQSSTKPISSSDKRPPRQYPSESNSNPFGSTSRRGASGRSQSGAGISGRDSSSAFASLSNSSSTGSSSRYASVSSASGSTVVRSGGKGAIWFDSSASNDELTSEELERKKAFEEFRKTHQATTGAGSFFGDLSNTEGEALEEDYHASIDEETFGTDLQEMKESSNASDLESYFFTLSSHQNDFGKESSLSELEDSFLNLPTPSSSTPTQKRDKPLFTLGDTKTDTMPPFVAEDPVISTVIKGSKSGKSRFGFGSFDEQQMQSNTSPASLLDEHLQTTTTTTGRATISQPGNINVSELFTYPQATTPNLQGLFSTISSLSSQQQSQVFPHLRPTNTIPEYFLAGNTQAGSSKFSTLEKVSTEQTKTTPPVQFDQFAVIDSSNQVSMMSAEDLENQFLSSLNDSTSQSPLKQATPTLESSKVVPALSNQGIEHLFKSLSSTVPSTDSFSTQNTVDLPLSTATTTTPKFVSPFQQYQEHKLSEKAEKAAEDNTQPVTPSSKQSTVSTSSQSATSTQRKLSKTSANSPFVPSHLMKKMGTNTEKKIKLKTTPSQASTATSTSNTQSTVKTVPQTSSLSNQPTTSSADVSTTSNVTTTNSNPPQQQQSSPTETMATTLPSTASSLPHYTSSQQNLQPQNMINTTQPPNMQPIHPVNPLMDQMQPQTRMMHDKRFLFNPNSPFPNNPSAFMPPMMHPGFVPPHQSFPNPGARFPNVPPGFLQNSGPMYPMFMPSQEMMSVEDLEKEFLNHK